MVVKDRRLIEIDFLTDFIATDPVIATANCNVMRASESAALTAS